MQRSHKRSRGIIIDRILQNVNNPKEFFDELKRRTESKLITVNVPIVPYKFVSEITNCMDSNNERNFISKMKLQWKSTIGKMFESWSEKK